MAMRFGRALSRLRRESGFETAYAFYHKNGGRRVFPFTYAYYLKLERGKSLPRARWLPMILSLLRIIPTDDLRRTFVLDYFHDICGDDDTFQELFSPLICAHARRKPENQAAKRLMTEQAYHMTPDQYKAVTASPEACWTFECLCNERRGLSPEDMAEILDIPAGKIRTALTALIRHKLAKKTRGGKFASPLADKFYVVPRAYKGIAKDEARLLAYEEEMTKRRGADIYRNGVMIRAEEGAARKAIRFFSEGLETANAYAVTEKGDSTALFLLQARVRRLFRF